ncbi:hypothetical protein AQUCO_02900083v1 [Aquilegia coerulea]|uniref:Transmembrane protein n=1 Tax=Aquilegia coerulea TaxID=218851 RepID=A0A2G5D391_AQUCA|nr:hypothetical protein AQUCO_02900083v1 [Aquilegia coerulea]
MALLIFWYDFICFAIVAISIFISIWIIWQNEGNPRHTEKSIYESLSEVDHLDDGSVTGVIKSTQLWTSCWCGVHPMWLMVYRLVSAIVMAGILAWDIREYDTSIFLYYTEWTFSLTIFYFVLAAIISTCGMFGKSHGGATKVEMEDVIKVQWYHEQGDVIAKSAGFCGCILQIVYQTCAGGVILTDIVFWIIIVPFLSIQHFNLKLLMVCMHTFNVLFLLLETALNNLSFPTFRLAYFVLWSCLYIIFQWIIHACGFPWWPYPFLELDTPWAPLWYFCLAMIHLPCYGLYALIVKLKYSLLPKWFPKAFERPC